MTKYVSNTVVKFERRDVDKYNVADYTSKKFSEFDDYVKDLADDFFDHYQMKDDDKIERISLELYGTPDYWDVLLLLNKRIPMFEFALGFDTLSDLTDSKIQKYIDVVYKTGLSNLAKNEMNDDYLNEFLDNNEKFRVLKIVRPSRMFEFLQGGFEKGVI